MTVEQFLERLDRARRTGPMAFQATCPAHEDRVASLSIGVGHDGRILLRCFAGCTVYDIASAVGVRVADLFADPPEPRPARPGMLRIPGPCVERPIVLPRARPVAAPVDETDIARWQQRLQQDDRILDRIWLVKGWRACTLDRLEVGWDGRRFTLPVRAPGGALLGVLRYLPGGQPKMLASRGAPRELWPAPEQVPGGLLVVVEGEPDAISGRELGLPTVAIPGAAAWRADWANRLSGRTVIIVSDCDQPGRDAAARARARLTGLADVRVVDLDPGRDDGHDLGDEVAVLAARGDLALRALRHRLLTTAGLPHTLPAPVVRAADDGVRGVRRA